MKEEKTYTTKEIASKINILTKRQDQLRLDRTDLSQQINQLKKQIEYWETLPTNQMKLF